MARHEFRLPDIGEGLAEAEVLQWLVRPGERVREDQPVVVMQTDKAAVEVPSPVQGVLVEQTASEGQVVQVGAVLFVVDTAAEQVTPPPAAARSAPSPLPQASPAVRRLARELGVDLDRLRGSGPRGRITEQDVRAAAAPPATVGGPPTPPSAAAPGAAPAAAAAGGAQEERIPLRGVRRRMAESMTLSARSIPHVTGFHEMDAAALSELWHRLRARAVARQLEFPLDVLMVRVAALALRRHPIFNASLDEERGEVVLKPSVNIGVAVATPQGLVVPVVHDADRLGLMELALEMQRLVTEARRGSPKLADLSGGTFTVTNSGAWGGWFGTSLIRPPEVAIMGVGRIQDRPVVREGKVVVRPVLPVAITFDHRVIDGEQGMLFAQTVRELVEGPEGLFLED